jgi:Zn finger protein HypA/HybF involved in hydrogenase expression
MHEYTIAVAVVERASREARIRGSGRVRKLRLRVGTYSAVEPALLESAFEFARLDTPCADAALEIVSGGDPDDLIIEQVDIEVANV